MSRTLKILVVAIAVVAVLALTVGGVYAFGGDRCGSGGSLCGWQDKAGCNGCGGCGSCDGSNGCTGSQRCDRNGCP